MRKKVRKIVNALALHTYNRILVRIAPDVFIDNKDAPSPILIQTQQKLKEAESSIDSKNRIIARKDNRISALTENLEAEKRKSVLSEQQSGWRLISTDENKYIGYPMPINTSYVRYKNDSFNLDITQYKTNLSQLVKTQLDNIDAYTRLQMKYINGLYMEITSACNDAKIRIKDHGYDLDEVVTLQEGICAIYRNNTWDTDKKLYSYLRNDIGVDICCNDCINCVYSISSKCRMYLPALNQNQERGG